MRSLRGFSFLSIMFLSLTLSPVSEVFAQDEVSVSVQVEEQAGEVVLSKLSVEDSLKICKDESGNAKACDNSDLISHLMLSVGGFKGMSALTIAYFIVKFLLMIFLSPFFKSMFPKLEQGRWKLFIAVSLNLVVGVMALMVPPVSLGIGAALTHSSVLALASVFANQAYKQFFTAKGDA